MFARFIGLVLILLSLFGTQMGYAETSLWKASKGDSTVYLGGTIHVLRSTDYPLPTQFEKTYRLADILIFEADITQASAPGAMSQMINALSYQDERTLASEVSAETYQQLKDYAGKFGASLQFFRKAKPGMMMSTFLAYELQKMGADQVGIDAYFLQKANKEGKQTLFLETMQQQIAFIAEMGIGEEDTFYQNMLRDFAQTSAQFTQIIQYWRNGQSAELDQFANLPMKTDYPKMFQTLLVERNNNWMPIIEHYFTTAPVEFVMVGAAHLVGEQGILAQLAAKGYQIHQL